MKAISVNGREFLYEVILSDSGCDRTDFFEGTRTYLRKKWYLFGKEVVIVEPKKVFTIWCNIEDPRRSKNDVKALILKRIDILNRKEEIKNGEII